MTAFHPLPKALVRTGETSSEGTGRGTLRSAREMLQFVSDLIDFLRALPTFEIKTFSTRAIFPIKSIEVQTEVEKVVGLWPIKAEESGDPGLTVTPTGISWERAEDGLKIKGIGGLSADTDYTVTVLVLGER